MLHRRILAVAVGTRFQQSVLLPLQPSLLRSALLCRGPSFFRFASSCHRESLYKIFGVKEDCTHQQLKEAFYRLSKLYHPDLTNDPNARVKFQELARAYEILGNPEKRKDYDRGLIQDSSILPRSHASIIPEDAIKYTGRDSFTSSYVKQYNRALGEAWFRQSDPELRKSVLELKRDERNLVSALLYVFVLSVVFTYVYWKWTEKPVELLPTPRPFDQSAQ